MINLDLDYEKIRTMSQELNRELNKKVFEADSVAEIDKILDETEATIIKVKAENDIFTELGQIYSLLASVVECTRATFHPYYQKKHY